jgi:hypothetical protein
MDLLLILEQFVQLFHSFVETKIHREYNHCENERGDHHDDSAFLEFGPGGPGYFGKELVAHFLDVSPDLIHGIQFCSFNNRAYHF